MLDGGSHDAKQLADLQHELETLQRRQASLEDSLLEVMERREELQAQQAGELASDRRRWRASWPKPSGRATMRSRRSSRPGTNVSRGVTN